MLHLRAWACDTHRDPVATNALFDRLKPTHVIHLAAFVGGLFRNLKYKVEFYRYNTLMNDAVMEACRLHGVCARSCMQARGRDATICARVHHVIEVGAV